MVEGIGGIMSKYVTDTHALYWYLSDDKRLGTKVRAIYQQALKNDILIFIPSIVLAELYWILNKQDKANIFPILFDVLDEASQFCFVDFQAEHVLLFDELSKIPEMHDRMIVVVAKILGIPCLTKDEKIINSNLVETIW
ncbi:type II toxin-antitoxin system VapC family toxin [Candidatus Poribacteria bacterium]|nr:type II toxin-antitoxin system VapC family toxin [Candidatus Poribacteria bacterium]